MKKLLFSFVFSLLFFTFLFKPVNALAYTITGTVFVDTNQNGIQDSSEAGYSGATVTLRSFTTPIQTATTDANGHYTVTNVSGTGYSLFLTMPSGYTNTTSQVLNIRNSIDTRQNFGVIPIPNNSFFSQNTDVFLQGITCPNSNGIFCIDVGYRVGSRGNIILTTNDGTNFNKVVDDNLQNNSLSTVVCPNSGGIFCIAGGSVIMTSSDGTSWNTVFTLPNGSNINRIACPNNGNILCIAVATGGTFSGSTIYTTTDGTNWTAVQNISNVGLFGISCPNNGGILCVAVGSTGANSGSLVLTTADGVNWTQVSKVPYPTNGNLLSVSCPHSNGIFCEAAGITDNGAQGIILSTPDGVTWTDAITPISNTSFNDIDCPNNGVAFCTAVASHNTHPLFLTTSNGNNWTTIDNSNWISVSGLKINTILNGIACPGSNGIICAAVGNIGQSTNLTDTAAVWNGWTIPPNAAPSLNSISNATVTAGATYSANGFFSDSDSTYWTGVVNYGDGSGTQSLALNFDKTFILNHQYNTAGTYTVTISISDNQGSIGTSTTTVTVNNAMPPTVGTITVTPNPAQVYTNVITSASFTSNSPTDAASWDWGDGNTTTGTVTENNGSGSVTNSHTYTALGSYTITLTVTNSLGLSNRAQTIVAISPSGGFNNANLSGKNYSGADLNGQNISGSNLSTGIFNNVNFTNANLSGVNGSRGSFTQSNFTSANLAGANFSSANFTNSNFTSAILTGGNFSNANFTNVNLTGANLNGSNFRGATIIDIIWSNTICPNGTNSDNDSGTCVGQGGGL